MGGTPRSRAMRTRAMGVQFQFSGDAGPRSGQVFARVCPKEQKNALSRPMAKIAIGRFDADVIFHFAIDIPQRPGQGHIRGDRKSKAIGMPDGRVGVLAQNDNAGVFGLRQCQCSEPLMRRRQDRACFPPQNRIDAWPVLAEERQIGPAAYLWQSCGVRHSM